MTEISIFQNAPDAVSFSAGETIFAQGDAADVMYAVREGEVDIVFRDTVLETVAPGGILGEMALVDDPPRSASAVAKTDCELVPVDKKNFTFLVQETPFFALQVMSIMAERLRRNNEAME